MTRYTAFQTTVFGATIRLVSGGRLLKYEDEVNVPEGYMGNEKQVRRSGSEDAEQGNDTNLMTWYGDDDPENPYNWSTAYKCFIVAQVSFINFAVYIGSSIYPAGITGPHTESITRVFNVSVTTGLLGLTTFVLGYGIGPMLWAPISEFPSIGRLPVYVLTLAVFVALQFPTIYANNIHTLLAMRFFAGFFGSPCLVLRSCTGSSSGWVYVSGKRVDVAIMTLTWMSGLCLVIIVLVSGKTSSKNSLKTQADIDASDMTTSKIVSMTLWRPMVLFFEPTLLVYNIYSGLLYGLLYIWFESFPMVFTEVHHFNPGQTGLAFLGLFIGTAYACYHFCYYIHQKLGPIIEANNGVISSPEVRLPPAFWGAACIPIAIPHHLYRIYGAGAYVLFQVIFAYLGDVYFNDMGSVFALNALFRAGFGAGFPLFANAMFKQLGIGGGNSLLGGIACLFVPAPLLFIKYGARIRASSKYAMHDKD